MLSKELLLVKFARKFQSFSQRKETNNNTLPNNQNTVFSIIESGNQSQSQNPCIIYNSHAQDAFDILQVINNEAHVDSNDQHSNVENISKTQKTPSFKSNNVQEPLELEVHDQDHECKEQCDQAQKKKVDGTNQQTIQWKKEIIKNIIKNRNNVTQNELIQQKNYKQPSREDQNTVSKPIQLNDHPNADFFQEMQEIQEVRDDLCISMPPEQQVCSSSGKQAALYECDEKFCQQRQLLRETNEKVMTSTLNNLLKLYRKVPHHILKCYMKEVCQKYGTSYSKLLISFGIEQIIAEFYQNHYFTIDFTAKYKVSQLAIMMPTFIRELSISHWSIIRQISFGLFRRFDILGSFANDWIINAIQRKRKLMIESGVNIAKIIADSKTFSSTNAISFEQTNKTDMQTAEYTTLKKYISTRYPDMISKIEEQSGSDFAHESSKAGLETNLAYFQKLVEDSHKLGNEVEPIQEINNYSGNQGASSNQFVDAEMQQYSQSKGRYLSNQTNIVLENENQHQHYLLIDFEICCVKLTVPQHAIFYEDQTCKTPEYDKQGDKQGKREKIKSKQAGKLQKKQSDQGQGQISGQYSLIDQICQKIFPAPIPKTSDSVSPTKKSIPILKQASGSGQPSACPSKQKKILVSPLFAQSQPSKPPKIMTPIPRLKSEAEFEAQCLQKLDHRIFKLHEKNPNFTMQQLLGLMGSVMSEDLRVPAEKQSKIMNLWFSKFKKR